MPSHCRVSVEIWGRRISILSNSNQSLDPLSPEIEGSATVTLSRRRRGTGRLWPHLRRCIVVLGLNFVRCSGRAYGLQIGRRQALWRNSPSKLRLRFDLKIWVSSSLSIYHICMCNMLILLSILHIIVNGPTLCFGNKVEDKILKVGEELWRETLPLHGGSCFYQLQGLKSHTWYEVKISYPASIPASFSIQLKRNKSDVVLNNNRRLLNTEKLIFKTNSNQDEFQLVLVTVEPEGFPAKLHVAERQFIIFNIVSDELLLGIPHKAWWVVALALLCLGIAFIVPSFLPLYLLPKKQVSRTDNYVSKTS